MYVHVRVISGVCVWGGLDYLSSKYMWVGIQYDLYIFLYLYLWISLLIYYFDQPKVKCHDEQSD